ncbi:MAG: DGQHR domain-containing protein [Dehalococcoidales bacterium]|jgi:DNA sulfur modification protein DndB
MVDKGDALNIRVWSLFERAGFDTKPNSNNPDEEKVILTNKKTRSLDLSASIGPLSVKIIRENTTQKKLPESFSTYVHDFIQLTKIAKANACLFVFTNINVNEQEKEYANKNHIQVWGEKELSYYEAIVDTIGEYAKYEIIHSFGIKTDEEVNIHNLLALKFQQPYNNSLSELFMFTTSPEKLLKTCVIFRKAQGSANTYQRMVNKRRLGSMKKYVVQNNAVLPPNLIVYLNDNVKWNPIPIPEKDLEGETITLAKKNYELGILSIPLEYASIEIIDGQHRLFGFVNTEPFTRENFNLTVIGLKNLDSNKKRDIFIAINDNMRRVDANLVTYLKYTENEVDCQENRELMAIKVVVGLNNCSPFKDKIKLLDIGKQYITLRNFTNDDLQSLLGPRGMLRKYYPSNNSEEYISVFRLYFNVVKTIFSLQWDNPEKYIIFTNRGISAFLKLLKPILKHCQSQLSEEIIKKYIMPIKENWGDEKWDRTKLKGMYVGTSGRKQFQRELIGIVQKSFPDFRE